MLLIATPTQATTIEPLPCTEPISTTIFIYDVHLGTRSAQAPAPLGLPERDDAETEHVVGDIIEFWKVRRGPIWTQSHNDVIQKLLRKSRKGSRIVYIPANHDEAFREYCGLNFGSIELRRDAIFEMDQPPPQLGPKSNADKTPMASSAATFTTPPTMIDGIHYLNCSDWVESAKTRVETHGGKLKVVLWGIGTASRGAASVSDSAYCCGGMNENPGRHRLLVPQVRDLAECRRLFCSDARPLD